MHHTVIGTHNIIIPSACRIRWVSTSCRTVFRGNSSYRCNRRINQCTQYACANTCSTCILTTIVTQNIVNYIIVWKSTSTSYGRSELPFIGGVKLDESVTLIPYIYFPRCISTVMESSIQLPCSRPVCSPPLNTCAWVQTVFIRQYITSQFGKIVCRTKNVGITSVRQIHSLSGHSRKRRRSLGWTSQFFRQRKRLIQCRFHIFRAVT